MKFPRQVPKDARNLSCWARQTFEVVDHSAVTIARFPLSEVAGFSRRDEGVSVYLMGRNISSTERNRRLAIHASYPTASLEETLLSLHDLTATFKKFAPGVYLRPDAVRRGDSESTWVRLCTGVAVSLQGPADRFPASRCRTSALTKFHS